MTDLCRAQGSGSGTLIGIDGDTASGDFDRDCKYAANPA
jgi:hypothetical protein